jgi:hypothetical protein
MSNARTSNSTPDNDAKSLVGTRQAGLGLLAPEGRSSLPREKAETHNFYLFDVRRVID